MGIIYDLLFKRREKEQVVFSISQHLVSGMDTLVYLHNSQSNPIDHVTIDDVAEAGIEYILRKCLKVADAEEKKEEAPKKKANIKPVYYVEERRGSTSQYR